MLETLKEELKIAIENNDVKEVTVIRGRLINEYKRVIKYKNKKGESVDNLINELKTEINKHKLQISSRYKNDFIDKKVKIKDFFVNFPTNIGLMVKKVKTCILDLKITKEKKEKNKKKLELAKSLGLLTATPFINIGKFVLDQWYILAGVLVVDDLINKVSTVNDKLQSMGISIGEVVETIGKSK